ncbi:DMT family transporter [Pseudoalteromonas sp. OOF1S-7]|uniref:DMT family transporter n=1 Tax=Pseudoalteromonas sp. OOF1S-7 TaxID=2917757 RepID=UPI001EF4703D|nr:DMT family transporter [Pseudoalteromonas sp. OOF1S-7]MCG7536934.1 DMT family transporter [Pseudoalteromonas sp. OOF1S-7]
MPLTSFLRLLCLAAIWGGSFLFMRIAAPTFGPAYLIEFRVSFAALALLMVALYLKQHLQFRLHARHYFILGLLNTALPFVLFAYAAQTLTVSMLAILNATAAIWGGLIAFFWHRSPLSVKSLSGMVLGIGGVVVLVGWDETLVLNKTIWPVLASVLAAVSYGIASNYAKNAPQIAAFDNAHGSMWAAAILLLPLLPFIPMRAVPVNTEISAVIALGVICTGIAYLLYFRLISEVGAVSALSVTFLIPLFGIVWGYLILDEQVGLNTLGGMVLVLTGTMLVTGFSPTTLLAGRAEHTQ